MFRKINQKTILILFVVLLALVVGVNFIDRQKNERTFKDDLVEVNADDITQILLYPRSMKGEEIKFEKENGSWMVFKAEKKYPADNNMVSSIIGELNRIKPESVASTSKQRWSQYEVTDSLGTKVVLKNKGRKVAEVVIGKMSFSQPQKATSYVRLEGDEVVYGVDGYLPMTFNRDLSSFRDKTVTGIKKDDLTRLTLTNPNDGTFVLEKGDKSWMIGSAPADSASVAGFLSGLQNLKHSVFTDDAPVGEALYKLKIEGNNIAEAVELAGYAALNDKLTVTSSQNKGSYFDGENLKEKIFPPKSNFLK
ncbi:MAG: hypothetical protein A2W90_14825 [Bacteroidetes bacterium GWF2_42_66]|nr:MAG: hypothetical protein A2W92_10990 [Bacteroidetes bacterium GWA2_42_15]OFX98966.1 MAG: hypothetical protein A2W89_06410 [Bacteroidetes bacterium GWE2_42_39]OFY46035.1 MAG: hypothetical protein A2W90_14825 [Bacteroidetes bacterium GWF2_42_66]HBL77199.1 hypothetical protein [Prolixibacteraceae bacterium]HCR90046.1 hypothetical protein [Prolixibacteraceae bacterium]